jgi:hypothetical protein
MLATISDHPGIVLAFIGFLILSIGYFTRKVLSKIDSNASLLSDIKFDFALQLANSRIEFREDMVKIFNNSCAERQCSKLQQAKLDTLTATHTAICAKLNRLDVERKEAWAEQRRWNDKLETIVYRSSEGK